MLDSLQEFQKRYEGKQRRTGNLKRYLSERTIKSNKDSKKKEIIRGISAYFNPGEMIAVMGPSGTELYMSLPFMYLIIIHVHVHVHIHVARLT